MPYDPNQYEIESNHGTIRVFVVDGGVMIVFPDGSEGRGWQLGADESWELGRVLHLAAAKSEVRDFLRKLH